MMLSADFSVHALLHPNQINRERNYTNQDDQGVYHLLVPQARKLITNLSDAVLGVMSATEI